MFCPTCKTEYREGFTDCADCRVALVHELPRAENHPPGDEQLASPPGTGWVVVFETDDVYDFLAAADALHRAGIPFAGNERYTGEFRTGKREQAPYVRTLLVPPEREEDASKALDSLTGQV
jgi:hypothetical protein